MSAGTELLWPGAALLLLLGTAAGLCVRCSRPGLKKAEKIYQQRSLQENRQSFAVARTYSLVRQPWPGPPTGVNPDMAPARNDKLLHFSSPLDGDGQDSDAAYIDPIAADYYNWGCSTKSPEDDDDATSYENVLICKPRALESGCPCVPAGVEETEDYQNSASIHQWRESRRAVEQGPIAGHPCPAGSPEEDAGEPDYVNGDVTMAGEA
ncbi:linker for activation of T-cells family member 2, transcript variant X2 [Ictidomys tridecemlineatus]|uniref:linker for activation of T-cells family member 2 isoform X3 n=1 Tax=Ictidomys tridecemlineatus TaxID=43179 RepID=UPI000B53C480|nr:linker for activation of T-cells family member 2 isoform X3 [Ictidomys tridecemlineatus]KAG3259786.1 linker for activation of T-cells family member 2, transcript variant X2 [Ictidomys tridecemlineatus]